MKGITPLLRTLAKSEYWQLIYSSAKELGNNLFENKENFSPLQIYFVHWLRFYSNMLEALASGLSPYLDMEVIEDDIRMDSYLVLQRKEREERQKQSLKDEIRGKMKGDRRADNVEETVFYKPKKVKK